jgi:hypothetical protein
LLSAVACKRSCKNSLSVSLDDDQTVIDVKHTNTTTTRRNGFLLFSLAGVQATVTSAKLRLYRNAITLRQGDQRALGRGHHLARARPPSPGKPPPTTRAARR